MFSSLILLVQNPEQPKENPFDLHGWYGVVFFLLFTTVFGVYLLIKSKGLQKRKWNKGEIPMKLDASEANLLEVYIAAGTALLVRDTNGNANKYPWLANYLHFHFPNAYYDYRESFMFSYRHVLKLDSLVDWCKSHLDKAQTIKLVEFLTLLGDSDGDLVENERLYVLKFLDKINLDIKELSEDVQVLLKTSSYQRERERRAKYSSVGKQKSSYELLGLQDNASEDEIKQAYRRLVKLIHPDRFMDDSPEVQNKMKEKFQHVQEAYDLLMENR